MPCVSIDPLDLFYILSFYNLELYWDLISLNHGSTEMGQSQYNSQKYSGRKKKREIKIVTAQVFTPLNYFSCNQSLLRSDRLMESTHELNINIPVPGRTQSLLENIPKTNSIMKTKHSKTSPGQITGNVSIRVRYPKLEMSSEWH